MAASGSDMLTGAGLKTVNVEGAVVQRYARAAEKVEPALCCAVSYDPALLKVIPDEVIERDYGCGDPSAHVQEGDTVLDLGSGGGKICGPISLVSIPISPIIPFARPSTSRHSTSSAARSRRRSRWFPTDRWTSYSRIAS